ncbi:pentapeptide repeat-containing protein [Natrinema salaciae]|uniref:Pentapeptide repeat-containing protein n=1 Tax=Natrinema salaciae TaxID=1186196 RepID=A0A1H9CS44_9EURY|nr:pentapeptide repeat-containing protein [Natrinema salaciae]SEQ03984.1 hypothetical protein SAMN04489841_1140 [Natrinema salaciae]
MCQFVFDPDLWFNEVRYLEEKWECPYPSLPGFSHCIFHILPHTRDRIFDSYAEIELEFIKAIRSVGFIDIICTTVRVLDLGKLSLVASLNRNIQLGYSTVVNELDISRSQIGRRTFIEDCWIESLNATDTVFESDFLLSGSKVKNAHFLNADFKRTSRFRDVRFGKTDFTEVEFRNVVSFCESIPEEANVYQVEKHLGKNPSVFKETPDFMNANFRNGAIFSGTLFKKAGNFYHANFEGGCTFHNTEFNIGCYFDFATFDSETEFVECELGIASFEKCVFDGPTIFDKSKLGGEKGYLQEQSIESHAIFEGISNHKSNNINNILVDSIPAHNFEEVLPHAASFTNCQSEDLLSLEGVKSNGSIKAFTSDLDFIELDFEFETSSPTISFHGSTIRGGTITISREDSFYELVRSTIGDVNIRTKSSKNPFKNLYIQNTNFDGFNFSDYREELRDVNWKIDGYVHNGEHNPSDKRETTYSKAKAGAEQIGDTYAESKFFIIEKRLRRENHRKQISDPRDKKDKIAGFWGYLSNLAYDYTCRYAESSSRVVGTSITAVLVFSLLYRLTDIDLAYESNFVLRAPSFVPAPTIPSKYVDELGIEYLIFSLESFTSFVLGGGPEVTNSTVRLLAALQSFLGAFLIGLFVATLVRTVKR